MGVSYRGVLWNRQKKIYDLTLLGGIVLYLGAFMGIFSALHPDATAETMMIRGFGTASFFLLHVILCIGPLARLEPRFLPLLYNRRHLGVTMFVLALGHGVLSIVQFHSLGDVNPLVSLFTSNPRFDSLSQFPFQPLGFFALVILFLMAATSHDFWLANLSAPVWKSLHMMVYVAYVLLVLHVALGVLQSERNPVLVAVMAVGLFTVLALHVASAIRESREDRPVESDEAAQEWVRVCSVDEIPESRAKVVVLSGERVAVFKWDGKVSAVSAVCQHQNGPLGEGRIIDGCITCPWHGYQYLPDSGRSPEPFNEKIPTFGVRIENGDVFVDPKPNAPGTAVEPAHV